MNATKKYEFIDALRGWAILSVVFVHNYNYIDYGKLPIWFSNIADKGQYGVQRFFILSALTLSLSYYSKSKVEDKPLTNYIIRRFFRIAPLFYLAIILYTLYFNYNYSFKFLLTNLLFIYNLHPVGNISIIPYGWTIGAEMLFYAIFPFLIHKIDTLNKSIYFTISITILSMCCKIFIESNFVILGISLDTSVSFAYRFILTQLPVFLMGITLYHLIFKIDKEKLYPDVILLISAFFFGNKFLGNIIPEFLVYSLIFMGFIYSLSLKPYIFFVNKFTIEIGKVSFSIYLFHNIILEIVKSAGYSYLIPNLVLNCIFRFVITLIICYLISKVSYEVIEKNTIKLGKVIIDQLNKRSKYKLESEHKP